MATLFNTKISATYPGLIKTIDNTALSATLKELTDGSGTASGVFMNTAGDFKVNSILEFGSLKDTGENIIITKFVDAADGIGNNNNDTSIPTSGAVKTYVDAVVTASDLDFLGDSNTGTPAVDLDSQNFSVLGTANEIVTSGANQILTIGLPNNVTISGTFTGATFAGQLNGTISSSTTATTQTAGDNSTKIATTAYVDTLDAASDLDFSGDSGTGDVNLNTQSLAITGTTNQIVTAASNQALSLSLPATVHRNLQGNVTGNVDGDLTGNVTATSVLVDGVTATTQASSDSSTKVATTAYVKGLDNASDLDITGDTGTGDVNLNTQTLNILGTTNEITTAVVNQTATISLPSTISVNVIGNVTGDLTGNADTATKWQTARDLSLTGQATGTLSNVDGALAVSGAVTLDNNSVTGKVLTGLASPSASSVLATDSILEAFGKVQSQVNGLANGLRFIGSWDASSNSPVLSSGGGEAANGTTTSTLTNKLVDSSASFTSTVTVGDQVVNQVDGQIALVTNIDSNTTLSIDADIMLTSEAYTIDNSPFITQGHYYVVSVGGTTSLNGINTWSVGDWVIAGANNEWTKLDHSQVDGTGTTGNIPKWSSTSVIADSIMAESGSVITVSGTLSTTTNLNSGSNFAVATNKFTANATTGAVAFEGDLAINTDKFTVNATSGNTLAAGTITSPTFLGDLNGTINTLTTAVTQSANNNSTKVATTAYVDTSAGLYLPLAGGIMTGDTIHNDSVKSIYGTSSDGLEIYHNGSNSYIDDSGTGSLFIRSDDNIYIRSYTGNQPFINATKGAGVQLFYNDSQKFETTSTGISVLGTISTFAGNVIGKSIVVGPAGNLNDTTGVSGTLQFGNGNTAFVTGSADAYIYKNQSALGSLPVGSLTFQLRSDTTGGAFAFVGQQTPIPLLTINSSGDSTFAGGLTGTSATFSGTVTSGGTIYSTLDSTFSTDGSISRNATVGLVMRGVAGSVFDLALYGAGGTALMTNATGTNNIVFNSGNVTVATNITTTAGFLQLGAVALPSAGVAAITNRSGSNNLYIQTSSGNTVLLVDGAQNTMYSAGSTEHSFLISNVPKLTIDSNGNSTFAGDVTIDNGTTSILTIEKDATGNGKIQFNDAGSQAAYIALDAIEDMTYYAAANNDQIFYAGGLLNETKTGSTSTFAGKVGIGTTTLEGKLSIDYTAAELPTSGTTSNSAIQVTSSLNNQLNLGLNTASGDYGGYIQVSDNNLAVPYPLNLQPNGGNVGIGSGTTGLGKLEVQQSATTAGLWVQTGGTTSSYTIAEFRTGTNAPALAIKGDGNSIFGGNVQVANSVTGGTFTVGRNGNNESILVESDANNTSEAYIRGYSTGAGSSTFYVWSNGNVQNINNSYTAISDIKLKENIVDATPKLDDLMKVKIKNYNLIGTDLKQIGVVAQELEDVFPNLIDEHQDKGKDENGKQIDLETTTKSVKYSVFVPILIKAIQELTAKVEKLEKNCNCK